MHLNIQYKILDEQAIGEIEQDMHIHISKNNFIGIKSRVYRKSISEKISDNVYIDIVLTNNTISIPYSINNNNTDLRIKVISSTNYDVGYTTVSTLIINLMKLIIKNLGK